MAGKLTPITNDYASVDEIVAFKDGEISRPFRLTRFLDIIRNDGPGEAAVKLDGGSVISLLAGDYVGPWPEYQCSTIFIQCITGGQSCRVRGVGV